MMGIFRTNVNANAKPKRTPSRSLNQRRFCSEVNRTREKYGSSYRGVSRAFSDECLDTYQLSHQAARSKITVQESDEVVLGKDDSGPKNDGSRRGSNRIAEGIERGCGHHEAAHDRYERGEVDS